MLLTLVCCITYSFEITFGLAGTILMLLLLQFFMDTKTLVIYSVLPQLLVASIGLWRSPNTVKPDFLFKMFAFSTMGGFIGLYLFYWFSSEMFQRLLAGTVTLFGVYLAFVPQARKLHPVVARGMDTLSGTSQALFGISGPIAMTRLLASFDDKTVVRNYALAFFLGLNLFRAGGYIINQTFSKDIVIWMLWSTPALIVSFWFANHLHFKINERIFRIVVAWIILFGGISLFFR